MVPVLVRPSTATVLDSRPATLRLTLGEPPTAELLAEQSGIITDIEVSNGDLVSNGDIIMRVSGRSIFMLISAAPLSGPVSGESDRRDIITIRKLLVATGHLAPEHETSDQFDSELAEAIADFNFARGIAAYDPVFSLEAVAWAPNSFVVSDLSIQLGSVALGPGATVLSGEPPLLGFDVEANEIPIDAQSDFVFVADGVTIQLDDDFDEEMNPELLRQLEPAEDGSFVLYGSVELRVPRVVDAVPITSVLNGVSGSCVVILNSEPTEAMSWQTIESSALGRHVIVDGGDLGRSFLSDALPGGVVVLANPRLSEQNLCP